MQIWWASLTIAEQVFALVALPATLILILQLILLLAGMGHHDSDADTDHDAGFDADHDHDFSFSHDGSDLDHDFDHDLDHDFDHDAGGHEGVFGENEAPQVHHADSGLRLFSVRGVIAFFAVAGWTGLAISRSGASLPLSIGAAVVAGFAVMLLLAVAMVYFYRLQTSGNMDLRNTVGQSGTVYLTIPPARREQGKVNLMVQGQYTELSAVTDDPEPLITGTQVTVVGVSGANTLVVKRK